MRYAMVVGCLLFPMVCSAETLLEDSRGAIVTCDGGGADVSCRIKRDRLATYVKCYEQMKDAILLMSQIAPGYSSPEVNAQPIPADQQDEIVDYWRETIQRCAGK